MMSVRDFVKSIHSSRRPETDHAHEFLERAELAGLIRWVPGSADRKRGAGSARVFEVLPLRRSES